MSFIKYIADENHYKEVLSLVGKAKQTVWIGTADIKDLYVDDKPFLALIASLLKKGVEVRLIHAKEPGTAWREDHEKHPILYGDICLADRSEEISDGNIVVAFVNGGLTVKQIDLSTKDKGYLRLVPANPNFKPIIIDAYDQFILQGKITSIHRDTSKY